MSTIRDRVALGTQWPTLDPFLFCVHHDDAYPAGNGEFGPDPSLLAGRDIGSDFAGLDGWRMYHGSNVPGFPQHPHRGFETVTFVRQGLIDHADSLGAAARYGQGDVQWLTAGGGIVHAEMFPLVDTDGPNPTELFQIWVNLARADKMATPHFTMFWADEIPTVSTRDEDGRESVVTVIAGRLGEVAPLPPPPDSWAAHPEADLAIWHVQLDDGARWTMPGAHDADTVRTVYVFGGGGVEIDGEQLDADHAAVVDPSKAVSVVAVDGAAQMLVLQGRPIGEPVARYGPFVMNDRVGIEQAFADYQRTGFGGWPWPEDGPVHRAEPGRFARYPDGRREEPRLRD